MHNSYDRLAQLLCEVPEYAVEGRLNKNIVAELARKYDAGLINKLLSDKDMKKLFFSESDAGLIFKKDIFLQFISQKEFLPDSYTAFEQKIGLASGGTMLRNDDRIVLNWPYKDCILEGGQTKEDTKRDEVFFNEILAPDEINTILEDKVFTNWKRYDKDGEHELDELKPNDNLVIKGNNLVVLHSLKKRFAGKVKLIYIDPPFNTGSDSFNYNDHFNESTWLTFMKNRLEVAKDLLADDGNIFVHIDNNESHYLKILMDEVFGKDNFVEEFIWCYGSASGGRAAGAKPVNIHDYILQYAKRYNARKQKKIYTPYSEKYISDWFKFKDDDGRVYRRRLRGRDEKGETIWIKQYLDESPGVPLTSVWTDIQQVYADPRAYKEGMENSTELAKGFSGQKPEKLLQRIIEMASDEGDIVLDYHLGTGTTIRAAHKMNRQYIGIEQLTYDEKCDPVSRLKKVLCGDQSGISKDVGWTGGGSFVYCNIKNDANKFREKVQAADDRKMDDLLDEVLHSSFLSYRIDAKNHNIKLGDFHRLSLADKKHILLDLIDNNTLYLNYSEIDDATYKISDEDKKHNKAFYGE